MRRAGEILALEKILRISYQRVPGKVIEVELELEQSSAVVSYKKGDPQGLEGVLLNSEAYSVIEILEVSPYEQA